jgi:hypothetical protein
MRPTLFRIDYLFAETVFPGVAVEAKVHNTAIDAAARDFCSHLLQVPGGVADEVFE